MMRSLAENEETSFVRRYFDGAGELYAAGAGYLCVALTAEACDRLQLPPQASNNTATLGTAFTISVDAHPRHGITTGVSAAERAKTIQLLIDPATMPGTPTTGAPFPLQAHPAPGAGTGGPDGGLGGFVRAGGTAAGGGDH